MRNSYKGGESPFIFNNGPGNRGIDDLKIKAMKKKLVFEGEATDFKNGHTGLWTDGIAIEGDNEPNAAFYFESGKKYRITAEEI